MRSLFAIAMAAGMLMPACAKPNYVKVDKAALGRVVVYRNGVAYYERRAHVVGDELKVTVPRDKVDDFLKSLTVVDAKTGKTLPVSFPRQSAARYGYVKMTISLPPAKVVPGKKKTKRVTDLVMTYVTESPAWKPSYRVMVGKNGGVRLEGWAVVDNTSGEDWKDVRVGVGSSSALSFRFDLWSVRDVLREKLANRDRFAIAPPRGMSPFQERSRGRRVVASLGDGEIPRSPGNPGYRPNRPVPSIDATGGSAESVRLSSKHAVKKSYYGRRGRYTRSRPRPRKPRSVTVKKEPDYKARWRYANRRVRILARKLKSANKRIVIEGYATKGEYRASHNAQNRANMLRNKLIENGVAPGMVRIENKGVVAGQKAGVKIVFDDRDRAKDNKKAGRTKVAKTKMPDTPVGESHFESNVPMTVRRGTSVMVSIVRQGTPGQVVYLYDSESRRGNRRYAFKSVRFKNPTGSTLETGPMTVYGKGRFIGEGLTDPIPPKAVAVVPFALDRQVIVEPLISKRDHVAKLVTLQRGIVTAKVQHVRRTRLKVTSRLHKATKVYLRHTGRKGWSLIKMPSRPERIGSAHLFKVELAAGQTKVVDIEEATPIMKTIDLRTPTGMNMMKVYLTSNPGAPEFRDQMHKLLGLQTKMADTQLNMGTVRQHLRDYRVRMDELHAQIVTLKAVKTKGQLMRHLKRKLKEISSRVQKSTIALVNLEEAHMKLRIRFQDGIAELTLDKKHKPGTATAKKTAKK